jgi:hypothetical protein
MKKTTVILTIFLLVLSNSLFPKSRKIELPVIYVAGSNSKLEKQAAQEVRRYIYLRTGKLPQIETIKNGNMVSENAIYLLNKSQAKLAFSNTDDKIKAKIQSLKSEDFYLRSSANSLSLIGGSETGLLYAAYRFAELLGVRFYLHDDVVPDEKLKEIKLAGIDELSKPLFTTRGLLPFHDFPEGPDWWSVDDYKAYFEQMTKMRMNFIGFHSYPVKPFEGYFKPEPMVWIGAKENINTDGSVKKAYPVMHFNTNDSTWGYYSKKTSDFGNGSSALFDTDNFGADYMKNVSKWPHTEAENIRIFNDFGKITDNVFRYAKRNGIKTCIGTETPLSFSKEIENQFGDSKLTENELRIKLYEGVFSRIMKTHPLDYYWFWTPEDWTWNGNNDKEVKHVAQDLSCAIQAKKNLNAPFKFATSGWVLGPQQDRTMFDKLLPKDIPFSCINRKVGYDSIDAGFNSLTDREKWAIPWMEDDPALTAQQLWVGRTRKDAVDALNYGCNGLIGIFWRTENLSPQIAALAQSGWSMGTWKDSVLLTKRDLPVDDFYKDWCSSQFGKEVSVEVSKIFTKIDGASKNQPPKIGQAHCHTANLYRPADWHDFSPGYIFSNPQKWQEIKSQFYFIDELIALKNKVKGTGNIERYDYWLNTFRYQKSMTELGCILGEIDSITTIVLNEKEKTIQKKLVNTQLIPRRKLSCDIWNEMYSYLLAKVNTPGELGTIANLEMHNLQNKQLLTKHDSVFSQILEAPMAALNFLTTYQGKSRLVVPTKRTVLESKEDFNVTVMVLTSGKVKSGSLYYTTLGKKIYQQLSFTNTNNGVYSVTIPKSQLRNKDFAYYLEFQLENEILRYPTGAPTENRTVIIVE